MSKLEVANIPSSVYVIDQNEDSVSTAKSQFAEHQREWQVTTIPPEILNSGVMATTNGVNPPSIRHLSK